MIDAHHGSDIKAFVQSLRRIRASNVEWLLPSHGPIFRKDDAVLDRTIARLDGYLHMADFGTCAIDWPLMDEFDRELAEGGRVAGLRTFTLVGLLGGALAVLSAEFGAWLLAGGVLGLSLLLAACYREAVRASGSLSVTTAVAMLLTLRLRWRRQP